MENETKLAIFLFILSGIIVIGAVVYVQAAKPATSPLLPDTCEPIVSGSGEINFLFFGDKKEAEHYADYIVSVSPFDEFKQEISFYYSTYQPTCRMYKGVAILCESPDLKVAASACPHDFIIVIEEHPTTVRSSAKGNVVSINSNLPDTVVIHELGHAVAHLAEEYINNQPPPRNSENCAGSCTKFAGTDCFAGCSQNSLVRSIDRGVMRTLDTHEYGEFDANLIRAKLEAFTSPNLLTGLATSPIDLCNDRRYVLITGSQQQDKIKVSSTELRSGCAPSSGTGSDSYAVSYDSFRAKEVSVSLAETFTDGLPESGEEILGEVVQDESFALAIPVEEGARSIDISSELDQVTVPIPEQEDNLLCKIN